MAEMLLKAQKYMNAKDAPAAIGDEEKPKEREGKREDRRDAKEKGENVKALTEVSRETKKLLG